MPALARGVILLWSGQVHLIPNGFVICDGNNGTPNLTDMFVVGAGDTYDPDDSGGNVNHNHDFTGDGHDHLLNLGSGVDGGFGWARDTSIVAVTGTTDNTNGLPPYYALAYIMKT